MACFGFIFYVISVVGNNTYSIDTKMGGGTQSASRYACGCAFVTATGFFAGEKEIFDFVFERVKRRIAAKRENILKIDIEI